MGRDKRIYRFVQDTRFGRIVLAESHDVPAIVDAVTDYVARRMIEREHAMVATPAPAEPEVARKAAPPRAGACSCSASSSARPRCLGWRSMRACAICSATGSDRGDDSCRNRLRGAGRCDHLAVIVLVRSRVSCIGSWLKLSPRGIHPQLSLAAQGCSSGWRSSIRLRAQGQRAGLARPAPVLPRLFAQRHQASCRCRPRSPTISGTSSSFTRANIRPSAASAFGGFLHHTPAVVLGANRKNNEGPAPGLVALLQGGEYRSGAGRAGCRCCLRSTPSTRSPAASPIIRNASSCARTARPREPHIAAAILRVRQSTEARRVSAIRRATAAAAIPAWRR